MISGDLIVGKDVSLGASCSRNTGNKQQKKATHNKNNTLQKKCLIEEVKIQKAKMKGVRLQNKRLLLELKNERRQENFFGITGTKAGVGNCNLTIEFYKY